MSFKSEAANVKANIAAGAYKEKTNIWGGFFDELAYGIKKQDEEKRQERLEQRREARAEARRVKAKQDAQDKQDQKDTKLTNMYLKLNDIDPTAQNISSVLSVVQGGARSITDLTTVMDKFTTVQRGTGMSTVPPVPSPSLPNPLNKRDGTILKKPDGTPATRSTEEKARDLEIAKTLNTERPFDADMIQFGVQDDDVMSMEIDAVRFELSDTTISDERRTLLKRRLASLTDPTTYENYTLYHPDGRTVEARTAEEEAEYRKQGYKPEKPPEAKDFKPRTLYNDGAKVEVYSAQDLSTYKSSGWSEVEPAETAEFKPRTVFKGGQKMEIFSQTDLDSAILDDWSAVEPAPEETYAKRTLYKDGAEVEVFSNEEYTKYTGDNWSPEKPKTAADFKQRTVYKGGETLEIFTQSDLTIALSGGWSAVKPADTVAYKDRIFYKDGAEVRVFSDADADDYVSAGWSPVKPADTEAFVTRTLYLNGSEQVVTSQEEMNTAISNGFSPIKPASPKNYAARVLYKDGAEVKVVSQEEFNSYTEDNWSPVKPAKSEGFKQRTLYGPSGSEVVVFTQSDMNRFLEGGFNVVKPATPEKFQARFMFKNNQKVKVFDEVEYTSYLQNGFSSVETTAETYTPRMYYNDGQEQKVLDQATQDELEAGGWSPIKLDDVAQIMADLKVDRTTAAKIQNKVLKITSDGFGRPMVVDISSSTSIPLNPQNTETIAQAFSRVNTASLTSEEIQELEVAKLELEEALAEAGFAGRINDLEDIAAAFGPEGFTGKIVNTITGVFNKTGMEDSAEATSTLNALGKVTKFNIISGFAGLRDSVSLKAEIETLLPKSGQFFSSKPDALRNFKDIKALLDQAMLGQQNIATKGTGISTTAESKANVALESLRPLSELYAKVIKSMEGDGKSDQVTGSVFKTETTTQINTTTRPSTSPTWEKFWETIQSVPKNQEGLESGKFTEKFFRDYWEEKYGGNE